MDEDEQRVIDQLDLLDQITTRITQYCLQGNHEEAGPTFLNICASLTCGFIYSTVDSRHKDEIFETYIILLRKLWEQGKKELEGEYH